MNVVRAVTFAINVAAVVSLLISEGFAIVYYLAPDVEQLRDEVLVDG